MFVLLGQVCTYILNPRTVSFSWSKSALCFIWWVVLTVWLILLDIQVPKVLASLVGSWYIEGNMGYSKERSYHVMLLRFWHEPSVIFGLWWETFGTKAYSMSYSLFGYEIVKKASDFSLPLPAFWAALIPGSLLFLLRLLLFIKLEHSARDARPTNWTIKY